MSYNAAAVQAAFGDWLTQDAPSDTGELRMFCPLCESPATSHTPSASINPTLGKWNCLKTEEDGGTIAALAKRLGVSIKAQRTVQAPEDGKPRVPTPLDDQDKPADWCAQLVAGRGPHLDFLTRERGLSIETIKHWRLGSDGQRITIPIAVAGQWVNVRRYKPHPPEGVPKIINLPGHGSPSVLAFTETLAGNTLPVVVTAGELDALLLWQAATERVAVVTGTGGESTPPRDLSPLNRREVYIAYDNDDAGRKGAQKLAKALAPVAGAVHVLDLRVLGVDNDGGDVTDYLLGGGTVGALLAEIERLRSADPAGDTVLTDLERLLLASDDEALDHMEDAFTDDALGSLNPPDFIVDRWLQRGFFSVVYGEPGTHKTFLGTDLTLHIRAGLAWHGHRVVQGAVLYYQGEGLAQMRERVGAWRTEHPHAELAAGLWFERFVDLTRAEGLAAVVRTVRAFERQSGERVQALLFDPLVEFMTGDENGEGTELASRGLRALAQYLDCAVLVLHHSNASGERARGADFLRMRAGAHVRIEHAEDGQIGLLQQKQKNAAPLAMLLEATPVHGSLVLSSLGTMTAEAYMARKVRRGSEAKAAERMERAAVVQTAKASQGRDLIVAAMRDNPGRGKAWLVAKCKGHGIGAPALELIVDELVAEGAASFTADGEAKNAPRHYYLTDGDAP